MTCAPGIFIFVLQMIKCAAPAHFIMHLSWMARRWLLLCDVNQCPVCTCPHSELDRTDISDPYRDSESVKRAVEEARSEHLDEDGEDKEQHGDEVS